MLDFEQNVVPGFINTNTFQNPGKFLKFTSGTCLLIKLRIKVIGPSHQVLKSGE